MTTRDPMLSVCMIVKNEAHQLGEALRNFRQFADEIVVVDTGSTDGTPDVALKSTQSVFHFPWCDDFAAARNHSLMQARGRYILWMDADDRVEPEMVERIVKLKDVFDDKAAFYFILQDMNKTGVTCSFYQLRCVPRRNDVRFVGRIHEQLTVGALFPVTVDIAIRHHGYLHKGIHQGKLERNLALLEKERDEGRDDAFIHYYLSLTCESLKRVPDSLGHMQRALAHLENEARRDQGPVAKQMSVRALTEGHFQMARLCLKAQKEPTALRHITLAQALAGDDASSQFNLGLAFQECARPRLAMRCFEKALDARPVLGLFPSAPLPPRERLLVHLALCHLRLKEYAAAAKRLQEAISLGLNPSEAWEILGFMALNNREWTIALHAYETARQTGELSAVGFYFLGFLYQQRKLTEKALDCYRKALEKDPGHENAKLGLERILSQLGRGPKGLNDWESHRNKCIDQAETFAATADVGLSEPTGGESCMPETC